MSLPVSSDTHAPAFVRQPPANLRVSVHQFAAVTTAPGLARQRVAQTLRTWNLDPLTGTAELLVSELMTNAVRASARLDHHPSPVALRLSWAATSLIIEVWDRDDQPPVLQEQSSDAEGGRGLYIVEALSTSTAYYPSPTGQGKVTWCLIEAPLPRRMTLAGSQAVFPPLPRRHAQAGPTAPLDVFDDMAVLRRVLDGLRALDTHLPRGNAMRY